MELPGGILSEAGALKREVDLRPMTGAVELALFATASAPATDRVARIDGLLSAVVDFTPFGSGPEALAVADRQFLLAQIARALGHDQFWITGACAECGQPFDAALDLTHLPVKEAGPGYPYATVDLPTGTVRVRAPTGADQAAVSAIADPREAIETLARRLIDPAEETGLALDDDVLTAIDAAAQAVSPEAAQALSTTCPECGASNGVSFDIAALLVSALANPLEDVHEIASTYHWSEAEILALPPERRQAYLDRIRRDLGVMQ